MKNWRSFSRFPGVFHDWLTWCVVTLVYHLQSKWRKWKLWNTECLDSLLWEKAPGDVSLINAAAPDTSQPEATSHIPLTSFPIIAAWRVWEQSKQECADRSESERGAGLLKCHWLPANDAATHPDETGSGWRTTIFWLQLLLAQHPVCRGWTILIWASQI